MRRLPPMLAVLALGLVALPATGSATTPSPSPTPASAAQSTTTGGDSADQKLQAALDQQAQLQAAKDALIAMVRVARDQQGQLAALIETNRKTILATEQQIAQQEQALHAATVRAQEERAAAVAARRQAETDRALLTAAVRQQYEQGDGGLNYVVTSDSFSDLMSRIAQSQQLTDRVTQLVTQLAADEQRARDNEARATADAATARAAAAALQVQEQTLKDDVAKENDLIVTLNVQSGSALAEIAQIDNQTAALAQQVADLRIGQLDATIADAQKAAWDEAQYYLQHHLGSLNLPGADGLANAANALSAGDGQIPAALLGSATRMVWAAPGSTITQGFGPSPYTFEPAAFGVAHFHTGIDMAAPYGTPIYAAAAGIVVAAAQGTTGYGNHLIIAVDGHTLDLYGHLQGFVVKAGDTVRQGQLIALMGSSGNSTGPHLHFEVRIDDVPVNPTPLLPALPPGASGPPPLR